MDQRSLILLLSEALGVIAVTLLVGLNKAFRNRQPLGFKYPRREVVVALTLFALTLFLATFFWQTLPPVTPPAGVEQAVWTRMLLAMAALALFGLALFVRKQPLRSAGWNRTLLAPSFRYGLALVFLTIFLRGAIFPLMRGFSQPLFYSLLLWLVIALAEETIFRGYIQLRLNSFLGENGSWAATAFLFVLWQLPRLLLNPQLFWLSLGIAILQSLLLSWMMKRTGHVAGIGMYRAVSEWIWLLG